MQILKSALLPYFALLCLHYAQRDPQCELVEYGSHWATLKNKFVSCPPAG